MTCQELVKKLNAKYNTHIFFTNLTGEVDGDMAVIYINSKIGEEFKFEVDINTLEIISVYRFAPVNFKTILSIAQGTQQEGNQGLKKQLGREIKKNRRFIRTLKKYAKLKPMNVFYPGKLYMPSQGETPYNWIDIAEDARKVLRKIKNEK